MRKIRKKTKKPRVPWNKTLIKEERKLLNEYGLRRKKEIRSAQAILRNLRQRARSLIAENDKIKEKILLEKIKKFGFSKGTNDLDNVLALEVKDILDRRLQTIIHKGGLAKTPKQARQMIVHGKVRINERKTIFPSYMVPVEEEGKISLIGD